MWFRLGWGGEGKQAVTAAARQDSQDIIKPQPTTQTPCALKEIHRHQMRHNSTIQNQLKTITYSKNNQSFSWHKVRRVYKSPKMKQVHIHDISVNIKHCEPDVGHSTIIYSEKKCACIVI